MRMRKRRKKKEEGRKEIEIQPAKIEQDGKRGKKEEQESAKGMAM